MNTTPKFVIKLGKRGNKLIYSRYFEKEALLIKPVTNLDQRDLTVLEKKSLHLSTFVAVVLVILSGAPVAAQQRNTDARAHPEGE